MKATGMRLLWIVVAAVVVALAAAAAWRADEGGEAQAPGAATEPGYRTDGWPQQLRSRTLRQGESSRIY
jgi:hypothetical protein